MGTRSCVARVRQTGSEQMGFEGRYIHWDGYPHGVGRTLFEECRRLGTDRVLRLLIDEHRNGWSCIAGCQLDLEPVNMRTRKHTDPETDAPQYYPDGDGSDAPVTETDDCGMEYAYVFEKIETGQYIMHILMAAMPDGSRAIGMFGMSPMDWRGKWKHIGRVELDSDTEIDWSSF
jgi:hypothetical protein